MARKGRHRWVMWNYERKLAGPKLLRLFAKCYPEAFFVEIGANDGEQHDHLRPFILSSSWRGIMVEPVPYVFERLRGNYRAIDRVNLQNVAIADRDGTMPFWHLRQVADREAEGLPQWYDTVGSFSREAVVNHAGFIPGLEERLTCVDVPCLTFDSLCRRCDAPRVDLLLVDAEGFDYQLLTSVNWDLHHPRLVIYEHYHLAAGERDDLRRRLEGLGYELMEEGFDTWCLDVRPDDGLTTAFRNLKPGVGALSVAEHR